MIKKLGMLLTAITTVMLLAPAAFAQADAAAGSSGNAKGLMAIAAAFGMGIAAFGCGLGQGRVASAACEGMARNPGAAGAVRTAAQRRHRGDGRRGLRRRGWITARYPGVCVVCGEPFRSGVMIRTTQWRTDGWRAECCANETEENR